MKYVKRQIELIEDLLRELKEKTEQPLKWQNIYTQDRLLEATAIVSASQTLVELVKRTAHTP